MIEAWAQLAIELIENKMAPHALGVGVLEYNRELKCRIKLCKDFARVFKGNNEVGSCRFLCTDHMAKECAELGFLPGQVTKEDVIAHQKKATEAWISLCDTAKKMGVPFGILNSLEPGLGLCIQKGDTALNMRLVLKDSDIVIDCTGPSLNCHVGLDKAAKVISCVFHIRLGPQ